VVITGIGVLSFLQETARSDTSAVNRANFFMMREILSGRIYINKLLRVVRAIHFFFHALPDNPKRKSRIAGA
jgi:hypothetical protein